MQKFVLQETSRKINDILKHPDLPQLTTLSKTGNVMNVNVSISIERNLLIFVFGFCSKKQGVIVLSRQWKNMLYNPMLFDHQYKNKLVRPLNVTFAVPQSEEVSASFFVLIKLQKDTKFHQETILN